MKLAVFDFDGTLFPENTLPFLLKQWKKQKYSKSKFYKTYLALISLYVRYKLGIETKMSKEQMKLLAVLKFNRLFKGMSEKEIAQYFKNCSSEIKVLLNDSVVEEVKRAQTEGYHTVLLSGAYEDLLKNIGKELGFNTVIGTKINYHNGMFDENKSVEVISGGLKVKELTNYFQSSDIDWKGSRAYADSYSDLDILKAVGEPIAVDPDKKLRSIAAQANWRVIKNTESKRL